MGKRGWVARRRWPRKRRLEMLAASSQEERNRISKKYAWRRWYTAKHNSYATLTDAEWQAIVASYGGRCAYCGETGKLQQDHVTPLSRGGVHTKENVVPACAVCNGAKRDWLLEECMPLDAIPVFLARYRVK